MIITQFVKIAQFIKLQPLSHDREKEAVIVIYQFNLFIFSKIFQAWPKPKCLFSLDLIIRYF